MTDRRGRDDYIVAFLRQSKSVDSGTTAALILFYNIAPSSVIMFVSFNYFAAFHTSRGAVSLQ